MEMEFRTRAIDKIYKRRHRYEIPDYQREEVWPQENKRKLIDSILRGWRLPKFYFLKTSDTDYEVVDGQQRLATIFEFLEGDLELGEEAAAEFGGATYENLPERYSDHFDDYEIDFDEISDASEEDIQEFFQRLQLGMRLNSAERLNAVPGKLTDFCRNKSKHKFFRERVRVGNKRYAHFDILAKALAVEIDGMSTGLRIGDLTETFQSNAGFSSNSQNAKRIGTALDFLHGALDDNALILRTRSLTQSVITLACRLVASGVEKSQGAQFNKFTKHFMAELVKQVELGHEATDEDYLAFQKTVNANVRSAVNTRHQILLRKLFQFDPSFAEKLDPATIAASGTKVAIGELADQIGELIKEINELHSSKEGKDLFKMSNKTVPALKIIGIQINSAVEYSKLIENLYFLIWEGPGSNLDEKPSSFRDVNDLRTALQHDVDHGKAAKVKSKQKKLGATFAKFSGISYPTAAAPERFPIVQLKLLSDIRGDLKKIKRSVSDEVEA